MNERIYPGRGEKKFFVVVTDNWLDIDDPYRVQRYGYAERHSAETCRLTFTNSVALRERYSAFIEEMN
jgi:hypothetical protein